MIGRETLGAGAAQHHPGRVPHHEGCRDDRISDTRHGGNGPGSSRGAVHHRGVELVRSRCGEHGAVTGVEQRRILEGGDARDYRVDSRSPAGQYRAASAERGCERSAVGAVPAAPRAPRQGARTAVHGENEWCRAHGIAR